MFIAKAERTNGHFPLYLGNQVNVRQSREQHTDRIRARPHIDLIRAPYVLYGVKYIDLRSISCIPCALDCPGTFPYALNGSHQSKATHCHMH